MRTQSVHRRLSFALQAILVTGIIAEIWAKQWFAAAMTIGIVAITLVPLFLAKRLRVFIPPEFALLSIAFVFASLFLGEVHGYYTRYWWWDMALHTWSGFLLGIVGFLLVYVLNEAEAVDVHLKPRFVAFFAFLFALGIGALWEIFEFGMDSLFGTNMQKEMLDDPSGLTDTMWDLTVDTLGALVITTVGYQYIKAARNASFLERWIQKFIDNNPELFDGR